MEAKPNQTWVVEKPNYPPAYWHSHAKWPMTLDDLPFTFYSHIAVFRPMWNCQRVAVSILEYLFFAIYNWGKSPLAYILYTYCTYIYFIYAYIYTDTSMWKQVFSKRCHNFLHHFPHNWVTPGPSSASAWLHHSLGTLPWLSIAVPREMATKCLEYGNIVTNKG